MNSVAQFPYLKSVGSYFEKFIGKKVGITLFNNCDLPTLSSREILTHIIFDTDDQAQRYLEIHFEKLSLYFKEYEYDFKISIDDYGKAIFIDSKVLENFSFIFTLD